MLSTQLRTELANQLDAAERGRAPIGPLTADHPDIDVVDAYEIQLNNIRRRCRTARGRRAQGRPVVEGDAADDGRRRTRLRPPARRHGVFEDRPGRRGALLPPAGRDRGRLRARRRPAGRRLHRAGRARRDRGVRAVHRADRQPDPRLADQLADTIADNASSAGFVLGATRVRPEDIDIRAHRRRSGPQRRDRGRGAQRRRARQPGDGRRLAGQQGRPLRRAAEGRAHRAARLVHAGGRRAARATIPRRVQRARLRVAVSSWKELA